MKRHASPSIWRFTVFLVLALLAVAMGGVLCGIVAVTALGMPRLVGAMITGGSIVLGLEIVPPALMLRLLRGTYRR